MSPHKKWLFIFLLAVFLLACEVPGLVVDIVEENLNYTAEDRCIEDGGDWYYNDKEGRWFCAPKFDIVPLMPPSSGEEVLTEVDISALAGTYVGTTTFGETIVASMDGGVVTENQIIITISEDGVVGGTFIVKVDGPPKASGDCKWQVFRTEKGVISGQITQPTGTVRLEFEKKTELVRNCFGGNNTTLHNSDLDFTINISENTIMGSGPEGDSFEATKQ